MFSLVVPFHRDVDRLARTLALAEEGLKRGVNEILLCHNGPPLDPAKWSALEAALPSNARLCHTDSKGIGAGYRLGIGQAREPYVVLSASDLPFGFTDVDAFRDLGETGVVAIGSKAHPRSDIADYTFQRRLASNAFYLVRRALLGRSTPRDSQGTVIAPTAVARSVTAAVQADDYFFSLEFLTLCLERGTRVIELPVTLDQENDESSVSLLRDSAVLFRKTWELRKRLKSAR